MPMIGNRARRQRAAAGFAFALPWMAGFLAFYAYPIAVSFYYSLTSFNVFQPPRWIGAANYLKLASDPLFSKSMANTVFVTFFGVPLNIAFGLGVAMLLNLKVKGMSLYRTVFYLPSIIPLVATSLLWIWILDAQNGVVNSALYALSLPRPNWLTDPAFTKPSLLLIGLWGTGQITIVFLAALQDIPRQLYEAADLDGASALKKFAAVTFPSITPVVLFQLVMGIIASFQYFTQAFLIAGARGGLNSPAAVGGTENSLMFWATYIYQNAFAYFKMGKASAMAWVLLLVVSLIAWALVRTSKRWVTYGAE